MYLYVLYPKTKRNITVQFKRFVRILYRTENTNSTTFTWRPLPITYHQSQLVGVRFFDSLLGVPGREPNKLPAPGWYGVEYPDLEPP